MPASAHGPEREHGERARRGAGAGLRELWLRLCSTMPPATGRRNRPRGVRAGREVYAAAEAGGSRRRGRSGAGRASTIARGRGAARAARPTSRGRGRRSPARTARSRRAAADGAPQERADDAEHGEDRQRRRVQPRREQRPAAAGDALGATCTRNISDVTAKKESQSRGESAAGPRQRAETPSSRRAARSPRVALHARRHARRASSSAMPPFTASRTG